MVSNPVRHLYGFKGWYVSIVSLENLNMLDAWDDWMQWGNLHLLLVVWLSLFLSFSLDLSIFLPTSHTLKQQNLENDYPSTNLLFSFFSLHFIIIIFYNHCTLLSLVSTQYLNKIAPVNCCQLKRARDTNFGVAEPNLILWAFGSACGWMGQD